MKQCRCQIYQNNNIIEPIFITYLKYDTVEIIDENKLG